MSQILSQTTPRARKEHTCYLCNRPIPVGEVHVKLVGETDGDFWHMRMHTVCHKHTADWFEDDWEYHDYQEFRAFYLKET